MIDDDPDFVGERRKIQHWSCQDHQERPTVQSPYGRHPISNPETSLGCPKVQLSAARLVDGGFPSDSSELEQSSGTPFELRGVRVYSPEREILDET